MHEYVSGRGHSLRVCQPHPLAMSSFPRLSYLSLYGGELHRKGGVLLKARLGEWERELHYLRFRIAEWKEFASVEHPDYQPFRSFLLQKVRHHLHFELKVGPPPRVSFGIRLCSGGVI